MPAILNTVVWPPFLELKSNTDGLVLNYQNQEILSKFYAERGRIKKRHASLHKRLV